jgi:hypothetical protein
MKTSVLVSTAALALASCSGTTAHRQGNGSITAIHSSWGKAEATYWITGAAAGRITPAERLSVFRKPHPGRPVSAHPVKCAGYIDTTAPARIEIRLVEMQQGSLRQSPVNGRHKLTDENSPKPFYHWLIP